MFPIVPGVTTGVFVEFRNIPRGLKKSIFDQEKTLVEKKANGIEGRSDIKTPNLALKSCPESGQHAMLLKNDFCTTPQKVRKITVNGSTARGLSRAR